MSEVLLDFDFATDLLLHSGLDDLRLIETLEGEDIFWLDLCANHVHATEFAFTQRAANVKVGKVPLPSGASPKEGG